MDDSIVVPANGFLQFVTAEWDKRGDRHASGEDLAGH